MDQPWIPVDKEYRLPYTFSYSEIFLLEEDIWPFENVHITFPENPAISTALLGNGLIQFEKTIFIKKS